MTLDDLPQELRQPGASAAPPAAAGSGRRPASPLAIAVGIRQRLLGRLSADRRPASAWSSTADRKRPSGEDWNAEFVAYERQRLVDALNEAKGNKSVAARLLGMPRSTFFSKVKKHGIV